MKHQTSIKPPSISIITPSYNQGRWLEDCLRSVAQQGYPSLEHIVLDGGSTDNSKNLISQHASHINYWRSHPDAGQAAAIDEGIRMANGDFVGWLNSDDLLLADALHALAVQIVNHPEKDVFIGACHNIDSEGKLISMRKPLIHDLDRLGLWSPGAGVHFHQPSCFFRRSSYFACGGININYHNVFDVDLWLRLINPGNYHLFTQSLSANRVHPEAKTHRDAFFREAEHLHMLMANDCPDMARSRLQEALPFLVAHYKHPKKILSTISTQNLIRTLFHRLPRHLLHPWRH